MKFAADFARNIAFGGAGETRYASNTLFRSSRAHVWFSATTVANNSAVQINPPAIFRDSSAVGSNANANITTTSSAKNSIELIASFERHSSRRSFASVVRVITVRVGEV